MIGHLYGSFYFMRFPVDHRTMHHINKKFNLWKVFFSCLAYVRFLVIKENMASWNLLENMASWTHYKILLMSVESCENYNEIETPIHIGPDYKLLTASQNLYNTSHILYAIIYWTFSKVPWKWDLTPPEMEKEYLSIFLWYFLEFRKVLLRYLQKDWLLFTTF